MFKFVWFSAILALIAYCNGGSLYENDLQEVSEENIKSPIMDIFDMGYVKTYTFGKRLYGN